MSEVLQVKIVFLGNTGVGKTCIINRFARDRFNEETDCTLGAIFTSKVIEYPDINISIRYQIWDTAGQEIYRCLASMYYKEATVAVLVYDITSKKTFEGLKQWIEELKEKADENIMIAIVGNKLDLLHLEEVKIDEAKEFAENNNALFTQTSAKDGMGINELFDSIAVRLKLFKSKEATTNRDSTKIKNKEKHKVKKNCC